MGLGTKLGREAVENRRFGGRVAEVILPFTGGTICPRLGDAALGETHSVEAIFDLWALSLWRTSGDHLNQPKANMTQIYIGKL